MSNKPVWVVVADQGTARILSLPSRGAALEEVERMTDEAMHEGKAQFRHDAYGKRAGGDRNSGASTTSSAAA